MYKVGQKLICIEKPGIFGIEIGDTFIVKHNNDSINSYYFVGPYVLQWTSGSEFEKGIATTEWCKYFKIIPNFKLRRKHV